MCCVLAFLYRNFIFLCICDEIRVSLRFNVVVFVFSVWLYCVRMESLYSSNCLSRCNWFFIVNCGVGANDNPLLSNCVSVCDSGKELRLCIVRYLL